MGRAHGAVSREMTQVEGQPSWELNMFRALKSLSNGKRSPYVDDFSRNTVK